jgi:hypothetical protein
MIDQWEQNEVMKGIEDILFILRHIPAEDVAFYLVKFNPKAADSLASHINAFLIDKEIVGE